jgi:1-acyl-sn-glycerol-3-phosphate acyltransferase
MLPPRLIRRLVLAPLVIVLAAGFLLMSPFLALLALVFGLVARARAGHMRSLRLVGFALVWFVAETIALVMLAGLWLASGFGGRLRTEPYQSRHYGVMRWFLDVLYDGAARTYGLRVEIDEPELTAAEAAARLARPVIVLSRHAGPGDSFLLVHQLLSAYQRRPRVVMKAALQLDPSVDIVANRLPNVFIEAQLTGENIFTSQIERLARGLDSTGALVIFPEGGNWTPHRWRRGIRRLENQGRSDLAERARDMPNLLPPRPGGTLAAISACPDADVIFVAHAGLDNIVTLGDVWGKFPIGQVIRARWWRVPFDQVPRDLDHEGQVQWLYDWWERIDTWISQNRPGGATVLEVAAAPEDETVETIGELTSSRGLARVQLGHRIAGSVDGPDTSAVSCDRRRLVELVASVRVADAGVHGPWGCGEDDPDQRGDSRRYPGSPGNAVAVFLRCRRRRRRRLIIPDCFWMGGRFPRRGREELDVDGDDRLAWRSLEGDASVQGAGAAGVHRDVKGVGYLVHAYPVVGRVGHAGAGDGRAEQLDRLVWRYRLPPYPPEVQHGRGRLDGGILERGHGGGGDLPAVVVGEFRQRLVRSRRPRQVIADQQ